MARIGRIVRLWSEAMTMMLLTASSADAIVYSAVSSSSSSSSTSHSHSSDASWADTRWSRDMTIASEYVADGRRRRRRRRLDDVKYDDEYGGTRCLSLLQKWYVRQIESIGIETWEIMAEYNVTSLAYYYKHHVSNDDGHGEYFGRYGERTGEIISNHRAMTSFWSNVTTGGEEGEASSSRGDVVLLGMHGSDLIDDANLLDTLMHMHRIDYGGAKFLMERIREIITMLPDEYDNPLLTANAMAIRSIDRGTGSVVDENGGGEGIEGGHEQRNSIIVGDGIFDFLSWLKLDDVGMTYIHSHEFGHHVQYDLGVNEIMGDGSAIPEATRWWEMMADSFGSYFIGHVVGGDMDETSLLDVHRTAYSLGDCESSIGTHHGWPRQRECASQYGAYLARLSYQDGGRILPPSTIRDIFNENYERMVRLDSEQCDAVVDDGTFDDQMYGDGDYSSYFAVANSNIELGISPVSDLDKPPPILQDENGTVVTKEEKGFWGMTIKWVPEEHASSYAAVEHSGVRLAFAVLSLSYVLLL